MALLEQGIIGPFRGKCGPIIGYIRNGQFCVRSMPTHYRDRRSERQLENRSRFTLVMKMMSLVRPVITMTLKRLATDMTEMNLATRANYYTLVKGQPQHLHYDYSGLILSQGNVEPIADLITTIQDTTLTLHWNSQSVPGGSQDNLSVVLLNTQRKTMKFFHNIAQRQDGTATIAIPSHWNHEEIYTYLLVERHGNWSNTHCPGTIPWPEQPSPSIPTPTSTPAPTPLSSKLSTLSSKQNSSHQSAVKLLLPSPPIRDHG